MMDILDVLILTDTGEAQPSDKATGSLYRILFWILGATLIVAGSFVFKSASMTWRVAHVPSLSTNAEQNEVRVLREMNVFSASMRRATTTKQD